MCISPLNYSAVLEYLHPCRRRPSSSRVIARQTRHAAATARTTCSGGSCDASPRRPLPRLQLQLQLPASQHRVLPRVLSRVRVRARARTRARMLARTRRRGWSASECSTCCPAASPPSTSSTSPRSATSRSAPTLLSGSFTSSTSSLTAAIT